MEHVATLLSQGPGETERLGRSLGRLLGPGHVVGLVGELGSGKTCLARGAASGLEVDPDLPVTSPTYTLVNVYPGRVTLYHIDLFRLSVPEELWEIGVDEYYRGDGVCLVEWFDRFPSSVPPGGVLVLRLEITGDLSRRIEVLACGEAHGHLAHAWVAGLAG